MGGVWGVGGGADLFRCGSLYQNDAINVQNPVICPDPVAPSQSLGVRELCGTFLFCGGTMVIALLIHLVLLAAAIGSRRPRTGGAEAGDAVPAAGGAANGGELKSDGGGGAGVGGRDAQQLAGRLADALGEVERILAKARKL